MTLIQSKSGHFQPAEWTEHRSCWLAWPSHGDLWNESLGSAQQEFVTLCRAIADLDPVSGQARGESLDILVPDQDRRQSAEKALAGLPVRFHLIPFGDIWLRDTAPLFLRDQDGSVSCARFKFNGWGEKYILPGDAEVSERIVASTGFRSRVFPWVLEGGAVEVDGEGTCLTTRQCLLNPNRNPGLNITQIEAGLREALGVSKVLWLNEGLLNDHTDGHIDTLARFVAPGVVVCMEALSSSKDPNHAQLEDIAKHLAGFVDAQGRKLRVVRVPSPGKILSDDGMIMPASYLNFYIGNSTVVVPTYGSPFDAEAVARIAELFPNRRTVGVSAISILLGGGAFHCITQQEPMGAKL